VKEYDLFVPLYYNDGTPVEKRKLRQPQLRLLSKFGGLTFFPQPSQGFWTSEDVTYRDEIVIYRVLASQTRTARRFFRQLKEELKRELEQEETLIIERDVETL
jgi:hypothetical protein